MRKDIYENLNTSKKLIKTYLTEARERIGAAKILFKERKLRDSISRSYYAFLEAARAALLTKGKMAKTHAGTLTLFDIEFGKTKLIPAELIKFYRQILKARMDADYELLRKFSEEEVKEAIKMAEEFVSFVEKNIIK